MTPTKNKLLKTNHTECVVCDSPLGSETREAGVMFCHSHRLCIFCSEPLSETELKWCFKKFLESTPLESLEPGNLELYRSRCAILNKKEPTVAVTQSEFDLLNLIRLMITPDPQLSQVTNEDKAVVYSAKFIADMSFEQIGLHISMMEACIFNCRLTLKSDPNYRKDILTEREKEKRDRERLAQAPQVKQNNRQESLQIQVEHFIEMHDPVNRDPAAVAKLVADMNKMIKTTMKSAPNMKEEQARDMAISFMKFNNQIRK